MNASSRKCRTTLFTKPRLGSGIARLSGATFGDYSSGRPSSAAGFTVSLHAAAAAGRERPSPASGVLRLATGLGHCRRRMDFPGAPGERWSGMVIRGYSAKVEPTRAVGLANLGHAGRNIRRGEDRHAYALGGPRFKLALDRDIRKLRKPWLQPAIDPQLDARTPRHLKMGQQVKHAVKRRGIRFHLNAGERGDTAKQAAQLLREHLLERCLASALCVHMTWHVHVDMNSAMIVDIWQAQFPALSAAQSGG